MSTAQMLQDAAIGAAGESAPIFLMLAIVWARMGWDRFFGDDE